MIFVKTDAYEYTYFHITFSQLFCSDNLLKKDVEGLAAKLKTGCKVKKPRMKTPPSPVSESCNIVVESAGVYVV